MKLLRSVLLPFLSLSLASATLTDEEHGEKLIAWINEEKGFFSPKLEMRRLDPEDPTSFFGMFAKGDFRKGDLMIRVPPKMIIDDEGFEEHLAMNCGTVRNLAKQIKLKDESDYAPYVNYLLDTQPPGQLPAAWSDDGKKLLTKVLSLDTGTLPPSYPLSWIEDDWYDECDGSTDTVEEYAALLVIQRAWDDILIPVFDMMSHRNGHWLNTMSNEVHEGESIKIRAKRDVKAGEQIYTTYNHCEDCGNRLYNYGTPEILRDYGFVEQFPQTWIFHDLEVGFRIDEALDEDGNPTGKIELVEWVQEDPDEEEMDDFEEVLQEVVKNKKKYLSKRDPAIPENEWKIVLEYMDAMEVAMNIAIKTYRETHDFNCIEEGTCTVSAEKYTDLNNWYGYRDENWTGHECDIEAIFQRFETTFEDLEEGDSQYQHIIWSWDPETRETCMDLDNIVQICDAYRPHYHEMAVHNTARFLPPNSVKRVLFVGGGDSMLLHEVLKYDSLELVVGLELDQKVTRGCFRHFGTQPHFHNDKVQWWFGDASKSLLMLPKEWFGSFDLVLVDLSETVMSFKVTGELDVLEALTLLVKPDGIFVKNEVYFEKFVNMFPYNAQINWYDNPVICSQVMGMGSKTIDFMRPTITDHGIEGFVLRDMDDIEDHYDLYHDYGKNESSIEICDAIGDLDTDTSTQTSSPGIILVVETEGATVNLSDPTVLKGTLSEALKKEGFTVVSTDAEEIGDGYLVSIVLAEGYVTARTLPSSQYCGFDIHFWSAFEKHETAMNALVRAVGSEGNPVSSYRVIAGGMYGVSTWQQDKKKNGPQYDEICEGYTKKEAKIDVEKADLKDMYTMVGDTLDLLDAETIKVALLCSAESVSACEKSGEELKKQDDVETVEIVTCSSMKDFNSYAEDASETITACERNILTTLKESAGDSKFNAIVVDPSAEMYVAAVLLRVLDRKRVHEAILEPESLILAPSTEKGDDWRTNFLKLVKDDVFGFEPGYYSEVTTKTNSGPFSLVLASNGDDFFINKLNITLSEIEELRGFTTEVELVHGGHFIYQHDFEPSYSYTPDDFDQTSPLEQWNTQKPLGLQVIAQMELQESDKIKGKKTQLSAATVREALKKSLYEDGDEDSIKEFPDLGDGCLFVDSWEGGTITILWDGKVHVDVNYFTFDENFDQAKKFETQFQSAIPNLVPTLRDEQPRGMGRVVSFNKDIDADPVPHWAPEWKAIS